MKIRTFPLGQTVLWDSAALGTGPYCIFLRTVYNPGFLQRAEKLECWTKVLAEWLKGTPVRPRWCGSHLFTYFLPPWSKVNYHPHPTDHSTPGCEQLYVVWMFGVFLISFTTFILINNHYLPNIWLLVLIAFYLAFGPDDEYAWLISFQQLFSNFLLSPDSTIGLSRSSSFIIFLLLFV